MQSDSIRRRILAAAVCCLTLACVALTAEAQAQARPPIEAFFQNPSFTGGKLSPNGRSVALGVALKNGRTQLVVVDVQKPTSATAAGGFGNADVIDFHWVNNERLVFTVVDQQAAVSDQTFGPRLYAVDRDGNDLRLLNDRSTDVPSRLVSDRHPVNTNTRFLATTRDKASDDVFVTSPVFNALREWVASDIFRIDTRTGRLTPFARPGQSVRWVLDAQDVPRATLTYEGNRGAISYLDPADDKWRKLAEFDSFGAGAFIPLAFGPDGALFVLARKGRDTEALYRFDLAKNALDGEPVLSLAGYDFSGELVMDKTRLLGVRYVSEAASTVWFDPDLKALQAKVDALLPATVNRLTPALRPEVPYALVNTSSDADPGRVLLYNTQTGQLTQLGEELPGIDPRQMGRMKLVRYKARDGLEIPAWLTLPKGSAGKQLPMVVLVHGGPYVRGGSWSWNSDSEFLASRGYAVLEPEFRGSTGFGSRHFRAGWKQWGLAMQDDVADGTRWAIAQGIADPKRVCIAGASYGGYATLMGLVNDPDLYRCGIEWAGVTDIDLMYSVVWSDFSDVFKTYGMPVLIGDREKDAAQLKATSPLLQAARIKQPLLLAYGGNDRRVPIVHGVKFRDAVKQTNPDVEWVDYAEEGHGWALPKNRVDFWTRVEKFLDRNIGAK